jgi:hypothetical protein
MAAAELALQRTGGSAALVAPPPLQEEAVRAVLGLQPSGLARPARGAICLPPVVGANALERTLRLCPHHPPPRGKAVGTGSAPLRPCHCFLSPPTPSMGLCSGALRVRWVAPLAL